jgi:hypothetical protein
VSKGNALALVIIVSIILWVLIIATYKAIALTGAPRYHAQVRCNHISEDALAHVKLMQYDVNGDGAYRIVFRCTSGW